MSGIMAAVMGFVGIARAAELADGDIIAVELAGARMIVYRSGDGFYAAQRQCLHQGYDLLDGLVDHGFLICPLHGWRYEAHTGRHEFSPETCLKTFAVRVTDGVVEVDPTPIWRGAPPA